MPAPVIYLLKIVEIDKNDRELRPLSSGADYDFVEPRDKCPPIWQTGQEVVGCRVPKTVLPALAIGNIGGEHMRACNTILGAIAVVLPIRYEMNGEPAGATLLAQLKFEGDFVARKCLLDVWLRPTVQCVAKNMPDVPIGDFCRFHAEEGFVLTVVEPVYFPVIQISDKRRNIVGNRFKPCRCRRPPVFSITEL